MPLVEELERSSFHCVDISVVSQVKEAVQAIYERHGRIDFLVNNAGIARDQLILRMREEDWDRVIEVNLKGCLQLHPHLPAIHAENRGRINREHRFCCWRYKKRGTG